MFCTTALFFFGGGALSWSSPLASRFLRLSRLLRFDFASSCTDALLGGIGEEPGFKSRLAPLNDGVPPGELTFEVGAQMPVGCPDAIAPRLLQQDTSPANIDAVSMTKISDYCLSDVRLRGGDTGYRTRRALSQGTKGQKQKFQGAMEFVNELPRETCQQGPRYW